MTQHNVVVSACKGCCIVICPVSHSSGWPQLAESNQVRSGLARTISWNACKLLLLLIKSGGHWAEGSHMAWLQSYSQLGSMGWMLAWSGLMLRCLHTNTQTDCELSKMQLKDDWLLVLPTAWNTLRMHGNSYLLIMKACKYDNCNAEIRAMQATLRWSQLPSSLLRLLSWHLGTQSQGSATNTCEIFYVSTHRSHANQVSNAVANSPMR